MANGDLIDTIKSILEDGKRITPATRDKLILAAIADTYKQIVNINAKLEARDIKDELRDKQVAGIMLTNRLLSVFGTMATAIVTAVLIMFITGKAEILFK